MQLELHAGVGVATTATGFRRDGRPRFQRPGVGEAKRRGAILSEVQVALFEVEVAGDAAEGGVKTPIGAIGSCESLHQGEAGVFHELGRAWRARSRADRCDGLNGLVRNSSTPTSAARSRSSSCPAAVIMVMYG